MLAPPRMPWTLRALDLMGRGVRRAGLPLWSFEPDTLVAQARAQTGLQDLGDESYREGLEVVCRSAENDANLTVPGRWGLHQLVLGALKTRLRLQNLRLTQPEIFDTPLEAPLIVMGLPRSGTTFLHRLLCRDPNARSLAFWEVRPGLPPHDGPDDRKAAIERTLWLAKWAAPELDAKHFVTADEPEECYYLLDPTMVSASFWVTAPVFEYQEWYRSQDQTAPYRVYRELLQVAQAANPGRRLTLKSPVHAASLAELKAAIPEALLVQTHREPLDVVVSLASLFHTLHSAVAHTQDVRRMASTTLDWQVESMFRNAAGRDTFPKEELHDVRYPDLIADPVRCVQGIYEQFGMPWGEEIETHLREHLANRPQHRFGKHTYAAADFGIDPEEVAERFSTYSDRYLDKTD